MTQATWEHQVTRIKLVERFDSVLYPVNLFALLDRVPELGWVVEDREDDEQGIRMKPPKRGNLRILIDQGNKLLGVAGNDLADVISGYRELLEAARELSDFPQLVETDYVEFRYLGEVKSAGVNPVEALDRWWSRAEHTSDLGSRLAEMLPSDASALAPYGFKFACSGLDANRSNWVELTLHPSPRSGHAWFNIDLLYRNEQPSVTESVAESAVTIIETALDELARP